MANAFCDVNGFVVSGLDCSIFSTFLDFTPKVSPPLLFSQFALDFRSAISRDITVVWQEQILAVESFCSLHPVQSPHLEHSPQLVHTLHVKHSHISAP